MSKEMTAFAYMINSCKQFQNQKSTSFLVDFFLSLKMRLIHQSTMNQQTC